MKKLSVLSLLMCVGSLTLAGCNNNPGGGRSKTSASSDTSTTGGTSATSSSSSGSSSTSGQSGPVYPTDWTDEQKAAMGAALDNLVLPYIPANWTVWSTTAFDFAVTTENLTAEEILAVYGATQGYSYLGKDSYQRDWYNVETTNGLAEVCIYQKSETQAAVGCGYYKGTSGAWDAADVTAMQAALFGATIPHPSGVWYGPEINPQSELAFYSFNNDSNVTIASVAESFEAAGYLTTADPMATTPGDMIISVLAPNKYQGQNVYVVGYIYAGQDYPVKIEAGVNLAPFVTDEYQLSASGLYFHQNDEVTLNLVKGNYFYDADQISVSPENAATLVSASGNSYVFSLQAESGEVTFTATNRGRNASVTVQVLAPDVPTDWTDEIKNAMDAKISNHRLPFAPGAWALVEQESFKIKSVKESASIDNIVTVFEAAGYSSDEDEGVYTLTYDDLYGLVTVVTYADEEFVYLEASYAIHAWSAADIAEMEDTFYGLVLPHPLGAWSPVTWNSSARADITTCEDPRLTTEMIIEAYLDADWLVMLYPEAGAGVYAASKDTGATSGGQPIFANVLFGKIGSNFIMQGFPSLTPYVDDSFTIEASSATVNQGSDVTITVTVGNYYGEEAVVTASPEDAVELKSSEDGVYVYTAVGDADTVVTFTAELENAGLQRNVAVTIVDPSVKTAWTDEEVAAMAELYGEAYTLPFFGDGWSLSYSDGVITASAEVTGVVDSIKEQIANSDATIYALGSTQLLPVANGIFTFAVIENEGVTYVYSSFTANETAWTAEEEATFTDNLGLVPTFVPSVHSTVIWNSEQGYASASLFNVSYDSFALALYSAGWSVVASSTGNYYVMGKFVTDSVRVTIQINAGESNNCSFYAYLQDLGQNAFPEAYATSWFRAISGQGEYTPALVACGEENVRYVVVYANASALRIRVCLPEAPADMNAVIAQYLSDCVAEGYTQYQESKYYDSPDEVFYIYCESNTATSFEIIYQFNS